MTSAVAPLGIRLSPLDVLLFRDGRPFGPTSRVVSKLPLPQTISGALRSELLGSQDFSFNDLQARLRANRSRQLDEPLVESLRNCGAPEWVLQTAVRGPWLALEDAAGGVTPLLAAPANLVRLDLGPAARGIWQAATPLQDPPRWLRPEPDLLPMWLPPGGPAAPGGRNPEYPGGFLTLDGVCKFLLGRLPVDDDWFDDSELYGFDPRIGIEIDADALTSERGKMYGVQFLALRPKIVRPRRPFHGCRIGLYAELLPASADARKSLEQALSGVPAIAVGGEGRYATLSLAASRVLWPESNQQLSRSAWMLATPATLTDADGKSTWRPNLPPGRLQAAALRAGTGVSGWNVTAGGPRATRFAVPAGAMYYVEGHESPFPAAGIEAADEGWGFALQGTW
ncbi:MAG: hypothetical protein HY000_12395 [Planctomycetes bacterium]|nr:hypothetical protein [Planctomycetota bacterium]